MSILKALLNRLAKVKPFEDTYSDVKEPLKHAINVCESWTESCHNLTGRNWKASKTHKWENDRYTPVAIFEYGKRLAEVLAIRSGREQYAILVKTVKDSDSSSSDDSKNSISFDCFRNIDALQFNPFTESVWREAVQAFDRSVSHVDQRTAQILKMHLRQAQSNPRQVSSSQI